MNPLSHLLRCDAQRRATRPDPTLIGGSAEIPARNAGARKFDAVLSVGLRQRCGGDG